MARRRGKYGAKITTRHGHKFRSKWEADRCDELLLLQRAGEITNLEFRNVRKFKLCADYFCERTGKMVKAPTYQPDFEYTDNDGKRIYEDSKGKTLAINKVKRKIVESRYGVTIWFTYRNGDRK
jgi:hypothetical protein